MSYLSSVGKRIVPEAESEHSPCKSWRECRIQSQSSKVGASARMQSTKVRVNLKWMLSGTSAAPPDQALRHRAIGCSVQVRLTEDFAEDRESKSQSCGARLGSEWDETHTCRGGCAGGPPPDPDMRYSYAGPSFTRAISLFVTKRTATAKPLYLSALLSEQQSTSWSCHIYSTTYWTYSQFQSQITNYLSSF